MGKITSFKETEDKRFLIELKGLIRFQIVKEINSNKKYRECEVNFEKFYEDLADKEDIKFSDLELIFKDLKNIFEKRIYNNWKALEKQSLDEIINALAMATIYFRGKTSSFGGTKFKIKKVKNSRYINYLYF